MKKTVKAAMAMAVLATPAFAANMENPLYAPKAMEGYSKTGLGLMYKKADDSLAMRAKNLDGKSEWPIYRVHEDIGFGITDRLAIRGRFQYTKDDDIDRKGLSDGRIGLNFRAFDGTSTDGIVWDVYGDFLLAGISRMDATVIASPDNMSGTYPLSFNYENYTHGRYGVNFGTQVGKTWDKFTGAAFAEVSRTFGNDNNQITVSSSGRTLVQAMVTGALMDKGLLAIQATPLATAYANGLNDAFSVDTKSTWEYSAGLKGFYELDSKWSLGAGFTFKHRAANSIEGTKIKNSADLGLLSSGLVTTDAVTATLEKQFLGSMKDNIDEYILSAAATYALTDTVQVALYGEYTFDKAGEKSQNGTDIKAELGARLNVAF